MPAFDPHETFDERRPVGALAVAHPAPDSAPPVGDRDAPSRDEAASLGRFRAVSAIRFSGSDVRLARLRQESPLRFLRPDAEPSDVKTVVLANTAGGIVGGDRLAFSVEASDGAALCVTGQAAEKIYGALDEPATLDCRFTSRRGASLEVLPQGTILFDRARLHRRTILEADEDAVLLYGEILCFGRHAMDETFGSGELRDTTEIRRGDRVVLTDALRLDGDLEAIFRSRAGLAGARAIAVVHLLHPSPSRLLDEVRAGLRANATDEVRVAAACHDDGPLVVRWLSRDASALRTSFGSTWAHLRSSVLGRPARMPRIWSI